MNLGPNTPELALINCYGAKNTLNSNILYQFKLITNVNSIICRNENEKYEWNEIQVYSL